MTITGSSERPAHIFIPNFTHGKGLVIDTAATCPLQKAYAHEVKSEPELTGKVLITSHLLWSLLEVFSEVVHPFSQQTDFKHLHQIFC